MLNGIKQISFTPSCLSPLKHYTNKVVNNKADNTANLVNTSGKPV